MGRTKLICLYDLIFIFQSIIFPLIYATPTTYTTVEESNNVYKDLLGLSQRIVILETKQNIYTEDRQRLTRLETTYSKDRQQMFGYFGHITETIKRQMETKEEYYKLNGTLAGVENEQRERMQNMQELRNQQEEVKNNLEEMRIEQQEIKRHMEEMGREQQEIKQSKEEMRREQQEIKQNMEQMRSKQNEMKYNIDEMKHTLRELKLAIATLSEQNKDNYGNQSVDINELKNNMEVHITEITETQNKNKTLSDIVQTVKYGADTERVINQQPNNFSSIVEGIQNNVQNESSHKQQINETDTYQVMLFSDTESNFLNLNQSLKEMQQRINNVEADLSHLQSQCNGHCMDSTATMLNIRNSMKQIESACHQNVHELDAIQMTRNLHIKSEFRILKQRLARATNRIQTLDSDVSLLLLINGPTLPKMVAFNAILNKETINLVAGKPIKFDLVTMNEGDAYNPSTGVFSCVKPGVYMLIWNLMPPPRKTIRAHLEVNGKEKAYSYVTSKPDYSNANNFYVCRLRKGDRVWLEYDWGNKALHILHSEFAGFYISG